MTTTTVASANKNNNNDNKNNNKNNNNSNSNSNNNNNSLTTTTTTTTSTKVSNENNLKLEEIPEAEAILRTTIKTLQKQLENYQALIDYQKDEINKLKKANEVEVIDVDDNNNITHITPQTANSKKRKRSEDGVGTGTINVPVDELEKNRKRFKEVKKEITATQNRLDDVQDDLEDAQENFGYQTLYTNFWQSKFDELMELAIQNGADQNAINDIRDRQYVS